MKEINFNSEILKTDMAYLEFLKENPQTALLKIRAFAANEAVPISGVNITVSKNIGEYKVVFYTGLTDESGMINNIKLPSPSKVISDEDVPKFTNYDVEATYDKQNFNKFYTISMCCNIGVIQYVNVFPNINVESRSYYGY